MKKAFLFAIAAAIVFPMISMADEPAAKPEKTEKVQKERKAPQGPTLFKFDANKDGVVTKDELPADNKFIEGMFNHTDADKDGKVTKDEEAARKAELKKRYEQYKAKAGDRPRRPQPPKGPRPQGPRPGFKGPQGPRGPMTLFKFDANKDGVVTKDELPKDNKFVEGMFNHTDADKDGKVTKEEEDAHKAELQKRYEQRKANGPKPGKPGKSGKKPAPEKK
jgi:hypothetical protein